MVGRDSSKSIVLVAGPILCAAVVALVLMKRCQASPESKPPSSQTRPPAGVENRGGNPAVDEPAVRTPEQNRPSDKSLDRPKGSAKLAVRVNDIFGGVVKGIRIRVTRSDGANLLSAPSGEDGGLDLPEGTWDDGVIQCGDFMHPVRLMQKGVPLDMPGRAAKIYGELAILPLGWDDVRVSLQGQESWHRPAVDDDRVGHRFLFLMPGTYEIADIRGQRLGNAEIHAGRRTTFTMTHWGGVRLNLAFVDPPEKVPASVALRIKGLSAGATHPAGYRIHMLVRNGQWTFSEYGLVPGVYEVSADEDGYTFSEVFEVTAGQVRPINVRLLRR